MISGQPVVLTAGAITLGSTVGSDLRNGNGLDPSKIVGGFLAILLCSVIAEVDTELGAGLAIALAGTAFVTYGIPALNGEKTFTPAQQKAAAAAGVKQGKVIQAGSNKAISKAAGVKPGSVLDRYINTPSR